jgi:hypothetical protein
MIIAVALFNDEYNENVKCEYVGIFDSIETAKENITEFIQSRSEVIEVVDNDTYVIAKFENPENNIVYKFAEYEMNKFFSDISLFSNEEFNNLQKECEFALGNF